VRSVIGRFLEHDRIFYFYNDGQRDVYLSSADWMERNFFRRIEICFPLLDPRLKRRVIAEGLKPYLKDNVQAWDMTAEGAYLRRRRRRPPYSAQAALLAELAAVPSEPRP
jgi:polyphosphate kinase